MKYNVSTVTAKNVAKEVVRPPGEILCLFHECFSGDVVAVNDNDFPASDMDAKKLDVCFRHV